MLSQRIMWSGWFCSWGSLISCFMKTVFRSIKLCHELSLGLLPQWYGAAKTERSTGHVRLDVWHLDISPKGKWKHQVSDLSSCCVGSISSSPTALFIYSFLEEYLCYFYLGFWREDRGVFKKCIQGEIIIDVSAFSVSFVSRAFTPFTITSMFSLAFPFPAYVLAEACLVAFHIPC